MARAKTIYRCASCGADSPKWLGRCPACGEWSSLVEELVAPTAGSSLASAGVTMVASGEGPALIAVVHPDGALPRPTGNAEVDRVLGGGLVPGSVTLLGGEPGIGKSTLLLQMLAGLAANGSSALYVSAEESRFQVRSRAERVGALAPSVWLASETALPNVLAHVDQVEPDVLVVDSIQTVYAPELGSAPGTVGQVRECAGRLVAETKRRGLTTILVGHVTKDGSLAGPRVLEHLVDTVLSFEGDNHHALRLLRAVKHRYGATSELGLFEMTTDGLQGIDDPSRLFLADRRPGVSGSVVAPTLDGHRPLLVELQALTVRSSLPSPRRSAQGLDSGRLAVNLAVLQQRAGVPVGDLDVYALAVGGARVHEPGADLALALAVASSLTGIPVPDDLVVCAELGLGGELRQVSQLDRRLAEAARHGFRRALVPLLSPAPPEGIEAVRVETLSEALAGVGIAGVD
jgi:DNA repair protein RadA/Sms